MDFAAPDPQQLASETRVFFREHPGELLRGLFSAAALNARIPMRLVENLARSLVGDRELPNLVIEVLPPGLRVRTQVDAMGTLLDVDAHLVVDRVTARPDELRVRVRAEAVDLKPVGKPKAPIAALLASDALDFAQIGALASWAPETHPAVVHATGNIIEVDLLRVPQLAEDASVRRALASLTPLCTLRGVSTTEYAVYLRLQPAPLGIARAARAVFRRE